MTTLFYTRLYGRFVQIQSNIRKKKLQEQLKAPLFLEAVSAIEII